MATSSREAYPLADDVRADVSGLDFDPEFARLVEGRSVVVVGPAETLLGAGRGREIDSFDVVVRFNTAVEYAPFADELARDIGARTDVLYCNNEVLGDRLARQQGLTSAGFVRACAAAGLKYFVGTNNDFTPGGAEGRHTRSREELAEFRQYLDGLGVPARARMLYSTPAVVRGWLRGHIGRTGFIGIVDLLRYDFRRLHITGMTFYHKGGHLFLEDCVAELHPLKNHRGILPAHMLGHNSYLELRLMRTLLECFAGRLELDAQVRELLQVRELFAAGGAEPPAGA